MHDSVDLQLTLLSHVLVLTGRKKMVVLESRSMFFFFFFFFFSRATPLVFFPPIPKHLLSMSLAKC